MTCDACRDLKGGVMAYGGSGFVNDGRDLSERVTDLPKLRGLRPYNQINVAL